MEALDTKLAIKCGAQPNQVHSTSIKNAWDFLDKIKNPVAAFSLDFRGSRWDPPYSLGEKCNIWIFHLSLSMPQHSTIMEKSSTGACCSTASLPLVGLKGFTQKHTGLGCRSHFTNLAIFWKLFKKRGGSNPCSKRTAEFVSGMHRQLFLLRGGESIPDWYY